MGFEVLPSRANFVLTRHARVPAGELFTALRERAIIVRYFERPRIRNYLRITVGTPEQIELLLAALKDRIGCE